MIGIAGLCKAAGTTHFSIQLANYLAEVRRKQTAVLEWNQSGCFEKISKVCGNREQTKHFSILDVHYYGSAGKEQLIDCINEGYQYIIIDFGDHYDDVRTEFLTCDFKYIVAALSEWQLQSFLDFSKDKKNREIKGLEYFTCFGSEEIRMEIKNAFNIKFWRIPVSEDAFTITKETMNFFESVVQ